MLFNCPILDTAYSFLEQTHTPMNSKEHFQKAAACGFPALKGDIQLTKDGGLVMCHDDGLTLNNEGRVVRFDRQYFRDFSDMTYAECRNLEYNAYHKELGHYANVTGFEDFVKICRDTNRVAYITARGRFIPQVVAEIFRVIRACGMEKRTLINSFTLETLQEVRKYSDTIPVSQVQPYGAVLECETVRKVHGLGNSIVTMFNMEHPGKYEQLKLSAEAMELAKSLDIPLHMAQVHEKESYDFLIHNGFTGFHMMKLLNQYHLPRG